MTDFEIPTRMNDGVPVKVWLTALDLGIHNDCVGASNPCQSCIDNVFDAFERHYGDSISVEEVIERIMRDVMDDEFVRSQSG